MLWENVEWTFRNEHLKISREYMYNGRFLNTKAMIIQNCLFGTFINPYLK